MVVALLSFLNMEIDVVIATTKSQVTTMMLNRLTAPEEMDVITMTEEAAADLVIREITELIEEIESSEKEETTEEMEDMRNVMVETEVNEEERVRIITAEGKIQRTPEVPALLTTKVETADKSVREIEEDLITGNQATDQDLEAIDEGAFELFELSLSFSQVQIHTVRKS